MNPNFEIQDDLLIKYTGSEPEVIIPEGITEIGDKAFRENASLVSVTMPDSLKKIGSEAFLKCAKLKNVEFSKNLEEIGYCAFSRCKGLKELFLPDTLRSVGGGAFSGCEKLQKIHCDSQVYEAGSNPFSTYDTKVPPAFIDKDGFLIFLNVLYEYSGKAREVIVPDGVTHIGWGVFRSGVYDWENKHLMESVVLPDSVRHIGNNAFSNCAKLRDIRMPQDVTVGVDAFLGCSGLADENGFFVHNGTLLAYCGNADTITIPAGTKSIAPNVFSCTYGANPGNKNIHTVILPEGLETIGSNAFGNCDLLERIEIPETVTAIGDGAFAGCDHLASVTIPEHIESIGTGVFQGCKNLADAEGFLIFNGVLQGFYSSNREITIPEGVTTITSRCFEKAGIRTVKLPGTLRKLGSAFIDCDLLEEIAIPEGITEIPARCFQGCVNLQKLQLPSTLESIGNTAFANCKSLKELHLPAGLKTLSNGAFENCASLLSVTIPEGVEELPFSCFNNCSRLAQVTLPESLKAICSRSFSNCTALTSVTLPDGLERIDYQAFSACTALTAVHGSNFRGEVQKDAFENCEALADRDGFVIIGHTLLRYTGSGGDVTVPEGVEELAENVFREGSVFEFRRYQTFRKEGSLKKLTLPGTLKKIGFGALAGCTQLHTLEIPEGVEKIGDEAFRGNGLSEIRLPESAVELGTALFRECVQLQTVHLAETATQLSKSMFLGCTKLATISLPATVHSIGDDAFRGCSALVDIQVADGNPFFASSDGILTDKSGRTLVWCPAGKNFPSYTIPDSIETIASHAFISCETLQKIVIPASVQNIGDEVFPRRKWNSNAGLKIIEADPAAGSGTLGENIFDIGTQGEKSLVFPKLPLHLVKEQAVQTLLALGYCMSPEKYQGEYAEIYKKYAASHEKSLLKKADSFKLPKVREYFTVTGSSASTKKTVNYKKLSPQGKVELLEEAVLSRDTAKAKTVIDGCGEFEFTARALGLACLYSTPEMVRLLVENGASFSYTYQPAFKKKYGASFNTTYNQYPACYSHLIAKTGISVYNPMLYTNSMEYHFGQLPKIDKPENSAEDRVEIARYLLTAPEAHFNAALAMSYAILWGCTPLAQYLLDAGIGPSADAVSALTDTAASIERNEFMLTLAALTPERCLYALKTFCTLMAALDKKIVLTQKAFEDRNCALLDAEVLRLVFADTDTSKLTKSKILETVIDKDDVRALSVLADVGAIKTVAQREKAIAYAMEQKKTESLAWLMDYKNKTADLAAEAAKAEAKIMRELTEDPNSVTAMKRIWGYKKQEDGTLEITSYKGLDEEVTVPEKIGKATVTALGEEAFCGSEYIRAKNWESRRKIRHVILPDTIRRVESRAFFMCLNLEKLDAPKSLTNYGINAFGRCSKLYDSNGFLILHNVLIDYTIPNGNIKAVVIPEGVTGIGAHAFHPQWSTDSLNKVQSFVLPESLEYIGESAFENLPRLRSIRIPDSVKKIGRRAFFGTGLEQIQWGSGIRHIGQLAFANTHFAQLRLPRSLTKLSSQALYGCKNLRDLYIPDTLTEIGDEVLGNYGDTGSSGWMEYHPTGLYVYTPEGSAADTYMKQYPGIYVSHDYSEE